MKPKNPSTIPVSLHPHALAYVSWESKTNPASTEEVRSLFRNVSSQYPFKHCPFVFDSPCPACGKEHLKIEKKYKKYFFLPKCQWKVFTFYKTTCLRILWGGLLSFLYFSFTELSRNDWGVLLLAVPAFPCSLALWLFKGDVEGKKKSNQNCRHGHKETSF